MQSLGYLARDYFAGVPAKNEIFKISKRIAKLIVKEQVKSSTNSIFNIDSSIFLKTYIIELPLDFSYNGETIKCYFFNNSLFPETITIYPNELESLFITICTTLERIFESIFSFSIQNIDYEILPGKNPAKQSVIMFSYNITKN
ncbi:MAG: hypothetical protein IJ809_03715 [Clostridia bacterium]|nr:hypothetical protein [Clostridia bacterium]